MFGRTIIALSLAFAAVAPASMAYAQDGVVLSGDAKVVRQVEENGTLVEKLEEPTKVIPGDRIVFTTKYVNGGTEAADALVITNPLPAPVALAEEGDFQVSVDGKSFGKLADLTVTDETGASRAATLGDVTHVRWVIPVIAAGETGTVHYFGIVR